MAALKECRICHQMGYEPGYGCHYCDADVRNNELTEVTTPQGKDWLEKDDPRIDLYRRWSRGEIQTRVSEQELLLLDEASGDPDELQHLAEHYEDLGACEETDKGSICTPILHTM